MSNLWHHLKMVTNQKANMKPPIDKDEALEIARRLETPPKEALEIYDTKPAGWNIYGDPGKDCWYVRLPSRAGIIESSRVCVISKKTGEVVFRGSAGDEG